MNAEQLSLMDVVRRASGPPGIVPRPAPPDDARWVVGIGRSNEGLYGWVSGEKDGRLIVEITKGTEWWPAGTFRGAKAAEWKDADEPH